MNLIALGIIMVLAALTVSSSETVPLRSLCVLDKDKVCWVSEAEGERREPQEGDYVISPSDFNRILDKLKASQ